MACMTHDCYDCNHMWFNNSSAFSCPKCKSDNITSAYDDYYDDRDDDQSDLDDEE